jgi:hypothetical protein
MFEIELSPQCQSMESGEEVIWNNNYEYNRVFAPLCTAQQQKDRPPGGLLPEVSRKARMTLEAGSFRLFRLFSILSKFRSIMLVHEISTCS